MYFPCWQKKYKNIVFVLAVLFFSGKDKVTLKKKNQRMHIRLNYIRELWSSVATKRSLVLFLVFVFLLIFFIQFFQYLLTFIKNQFFTLMYLTGSCCSHILLIYTIIKIVLQNRALVILKLFRLLTYFLAKAI